jgi:hypothetical protein
VANPGAPLITHRYIYFAGTLDNRVHGQWASSLLLAAGVLVLFGAILLIMRVRKMIKELGDKTWELLRRILTVVIPFLVLLGVILVGIDIKDAVTEPVAALTAVQLAVGSENVPFFTDPEVQPRDRRVGVTCPSGAASAWVPDLTAG